MKYVTFPNYYVFFTLYTNCYENNIVNVDVAMYVMHCIISLFFRQKKSCCLGLHVHAEELEWVGQDYFFFHQILEHSGLNSFKKSIFVQKIEKRDPKFLNTNKRLIVGPII